MDVTGSRMLYLLGRQQAMADLLPALAYALLKRDALEILVSSAERELESNHGLGAEEAVEAGKARLDLLRHVLAEWDRMDAEARSG